MKSLSKKLFLSIMSVVLTFIALGTTTFAWFTLGGSVSFSGVTAQMDSSKGIEMSLGASTNWAWGNSIDLTKTLIMDPVTSNDGVTFTDMNGISVTYSNQEGDSNVFFSYTVYVRASEATDIELALLEIPRFGSRPTTGDLPSWTPDVSFGTFKGTNYVASEGAYVFDPLNAIRFSFVPYEVKAETVTSTSQFNITEEPIILADKANEIFAIADNAVENNTNRDDVSATTDITSETSSMAFAFAKAKGATILNTTQPANAKNVAGGSVTVNNAVVTEDDFVELADLTAAGFKFYAAFQLNIWLEGWDGDCINAILGLPGTSIGFTLRAKETA